MSFCYRNYRDIGFFIIAQPYSRGLYTTIVSHADLADVIFPLKGMIFRTCGQHIQKSSIKSLYQTIALRVVGGGSSFIDFQ